MQKLLIAGTIAVGLGIGTLWPATRGAGQAANTPVASETVLDRSADGHFYADAQVNGSSVRFLVDTGSSMIALSEADAKKAGIDFDPADFTLIGEGASGMVRGKELTLAKLAVGGVEQHDVKAAVIEGATTSLLGAPFLDSVDEITIRKGEMTLRKTV